MGTVGEERVHLFAFRHWTPRPPDTGVGAGGDPFARSGQMTVDPDGVTITDEKGRVVVWTPPKDADLSFAAMVKYLTDVVTALRDAGALTPRR